MIKIYLEIQLVLPQVKPRTWPKNYWRKGLILKHDSPKKALPYFELSPVKWSKKESPGARFILVLNAFLFFGIHLRHKYLS